MDWSEKNSCIKCDNGGNLLVCSENGCPLAVHEGCLGYPPKFDDSGRFYCPYCLYKQTVGEARRAREYALARKKALLVFMEEKVIGSENHDQEKKACEGNGHSQSKPSDANGNITSSEDGKSELNNSGVTDKPFLLDREEMTCNAEEDLEDSAGSEGDDMNVGESKRTEEEKQVQEEEHEAFAEEQIQEKENEISAQKQIQEEDHGTSAEEQIQKEEREALVVEEQTQEDKKETSSASTDQDPSLTGHARAKRGSKRSEQVDKDSHANPVRSKSVRQHDNKRQTCTTVIPTRRSSRKSSATMRTRKVSNDEVGSHRRLRKPKELSVKLASDAFGCGKRKKLKWTEEEEEALRAGVEKCSKESKSVPWRKILELRPRMFDATRTPADLKDKWRNMSERITDVFR